MKNRLLQIILLIILITSCEQPRTVSVIPVIELEDITFQRAIDTLSNEILAITFGMFIEDGDANIAAEYDDSTGAGFYLGYYEKLDGVYQPILTSDNDTNTYFRIDPTGYEDIFDKVGLNKTLTGRAEVTITHSINFVNKYDTIAYQIFLMDSEENQSNIEQYEDFPLTFLDTIVYFKKSVD